MFTAITIFSIPMYYAFSKNDIGYFKTSYSSFDKFTLGNLGGANVVCQQATIIKAATVEILCPHGTEMEFENLTYGLINPNLIKQNFCLE